MHIHLFVTSPDHVSLVENSQAAQSVAHTASSSSSTVLQLHCKVQS
jgi:hypothetical protein